MHGYQCVNISDCDQSEVRNFSQSIKRALFIDYLKIETHYHHHKFSECFYQKIKRLTNNIIDNVGAPDYMWLLVLIYVCLISNHTYDAGNNGIQSTKDIGYTSDIIPLLQFCFW